MTPAAFPPSDLLRRQPSNSLFRGSVFLRRLLSRNARGPFFIGVFRSRRSRWTKDRRPRSSEVETSWAHAAMYFRPRGTLPFPACWASGLQFKPIAFVSKILNRALWPCPFWCPEAPGKSETLKKTFSGKTGLIPNKWENYEVFPKSL